MKTYAWKSLRIRQKPAWPAQPIRIWLPGWALLCLLTFAGCSNPQVITRTVTIKLKPPAVLLLPTPEPQLQGADNAALLDLLLDLRAALRSCNADKAGLREWMQENDGDKP